MTAVLAEVYETSISLWYVGYQLVALFILAVALTIIALLQPRSIESLLRRTRGISPEAIVGHLTSEEPVGPGLLCRQIVERAEQIHQTLVENPSEIEVEMCVLGYRACVEDMGLLVDIIEAELPVSGALRRRRLRTMRSKAGDAVFHMHEAFPAGMVFPTYQERP